MSKVTIKKPKTKNDISIMVIKDYAFDTKLECWAYSDAVILDIGDSTVTMTPKQAERLFKFIQTEVKRN